MYFDDLEQETTHSVNLHAYFFSDRFSLTDLILIDISFVNKCLLPIL